MEDYIASVARMLDAIDIPRSLSEIGVHADCAQWIAEKTIRDSAAGTNPRAVTVTGIKMLTETAIAQAR